ncbi:hypothetical protein QAD02_021686 [Eretmocerus hayati]|uniref:Uncharacterized protein n=1 Tax=Eretmocerus hayati TaxID=131215 RepID=A0ACC2PS04_9HYME|nr:hypothetical protein QAD02_021686 [Eretmocerus hayati]
MLKQYPNTFEDRKPDGTRLGEGDNCPVERLQNRNTQINRFEPKSLNQTLGITVKEHKAIESIKSGCKNWQPNYPLGETATTQEQRRIRLLNYKDTQYTNCLEDFKLSFATQQIFLNDRKTKPTAQDFLTKWPVMIDANYHLQHFVLLTEVDVDNVIKRFVDDIPIVLEYGRSLKEPIVVPESNTT